MTNPKIGDLRMLCIKGTVFDGVYVEKFVGGEFLPWQGLATFNKKSHARLFIKALKQSRRGKSK